MREIFLTKSAGFIHFTFWTSFYPSNRNQTIQWLISVNVWVWHQVSTNTSTKRWSNVLWTRVFNFLIFTDVGRAIEPLEKHQTSTIHHDWYSIFIDLTGFVFCLAGEVSVTKFAASQKELQSVSRSVHGVNETVDISGSQVQNVFLLYSNRCVFNPIVILCWLIM